MAKIFKLFKVIPQNHEIKSKFCCWTLLFSNEMSAKNIKFTS